ncbi:MAG: oligopeptide:H+ symporter [Rothia sp. (in: high G+C Gram-positive bacteria)]|uniref:peptide MFS transporter n=1 Tax=Rothia sp. (in: high G+C Gram-positive bacteria) TaxID=1885016 RepID=UPI0026DCBD96|nr:oligopeptide:H+ symporter [Rothia sp. (in: high G+C Gram-positive bacteria)]MDO4883402.1 oligopeptide:H+ symporter [Rothia sp. (in: high G+C Gram-positive bacteria)]
MSATAPVTEHKHHNRTFFGHPPMLANLFTVEMWERFSFYGMQVLALYYLYFSIDKGGLGLPKEAATSAMGAYGATVYLMAILGGILGDRVLGPERTLFYSAIGIMMGHIALAVIPGAVGVIVGLLLVAIGSGCLKSSASVLVGSLYNKDDPKREAGFTLFYIGINIGALLGPALTGWGWDMLGFHVGFGIAALGMAAGLIQYTLTRKHLPESVHEVTAPFTKHQNNTFIGILAGVALVTVLLVALGWMTPGNLATWVVSAVGIGAVALFIQLLTSKKVTSIERSRVWAFIPLWIANAIFWALYQQQFTIIPIYSEERLDWHILNMDLPPSLVNSLAPIFVILLGTGFTAMWTKLGDRQPLTTTKFSLALVTIGPAYWVFLTQVGVAKVAVFWMVIIMFIFTIAELTISPVGLALTTRLAPEAYKVNMMALYWTSLAMGTAFAGWCAKFYSIETEVTYFTWVGVVSVIAGIVLFLCRSPVQKLMRGVK